MVNGVSRNVHAYERTDTTRIAFARVSRAAGSLGHSCFDPRPMLVGASGGGYALIGAHLANLFRVCTLRYSITIVCNTISTTENS